MSLPSGASGRMEGFFESRGLLGTCQLENAKLELTM